MNRPKHFSFNAQFMMNGDYYVVDNLTMHASYVKTTIIICIAQIYEYLSTAYELLVVVHLLDSATQLQGL